MPVVPAAPTLADPAEASRWEEVARAWRLLYGQWRPDLEAAVEQAIGHVRREAWGRVDLSANLYRQVWDALATLYDSAPNVEHSDPAGAELARLVSESGYWSRMQRIQRDTLGLREMLVRVDVVDGLLTYRSVTPGHVTVEVDEDRPDLPVQLWEQRRRLYESEWRWTWDYVDREGTYQVLDREGRDVSDQYLGEDVSDYPWPYVVYHASDTGRMWDSCSVLELVEGTYQGGVYYSHFAHALMQAAWRQRYGIDVTAVGASLQSDGAYQGVVVDPTTVALFRRTDDERPPVLGQWDSPVDPEAMVRAIQLWEQRLVSFAGVNSADQMRMSGDPRSGYAVSVSRDAQRQVQRRYEPVFRRSDLDLLAVSATMLNRATGSSYPTTGYRISYRGIPLSAEERDSLRRHVLEQVAAGLMSRVAAVRELSPGLSVEEATRMLAEIDAPAQQPAGVP